MSSRQPNAATAQSSGSPWLFSGANAAKHAQQEIEKAKEAQQRAGIYRFYLKENEAAEIVILDRDRERLFCRHEHAIPGPGDNWKEVEYITSPRSIGQVDPLENHPVCNGKTSKPYFAEYLTVLDLRPYTNKEGQAVPYTRKLLCIKQSQITEFDDLFKKIQNKYGTIRGFHFKLSRFSAGGAQSTSIGKPGPLDNLEFGHFTEEQLIQRFGHPEIKNKDGKVIIPANGKLEPILYWAEGREKESYFKITTTEDICRRFGIGEYAGQGGQGVPPIGSRQEEAQVWGEALEQGVAPEQQAPATAPHVAEEISEDDIPF